MIKERAMEMLPVVVQSEPTPGNENVDNTKCDVDCDVETANARTTRATLGGSKL